MLKIAPQHELLLMQYYLLLSKQKSNLLIFGFASNQILEPKPFKLGIFPLLECRKAGMQDGEKGLKSWLLLLLRTRRSRCMGNLAAANVCTFFRHWYYLDISHEVVENYCRENVSVVKCCSSFDKHKNMEIAFHESVAASRILRSVKMIHYYCVLTPLKQNFKGSMHNMKPFAPFHHHHYIFQSFKMICIF